MECSQHEPAPARSSQHIGIGPQPPELCTYSVWQVTLSAVILSLYFVHHFITFIYIDVTGNNLFHRWEVSNRRRTGGVTKYVHSPAQTLGNAGSTNQNRETLAIIDPWGGVWDKFFIHFHRKSAQVSSSLQILSKFKEIRQRRPEFQGSYTWNNCLSSAEQFTNRRCKWMLMIL